MFFKKSKLKIVWLINFLFGFFALVVFFQNPSEKTSNLFLGYSPTRIAIGFVFFLLLITYLIIGILSFKTKGKIHSLINFVLTNRYYGYALVTCFFTILLFIISLTFIYLSPVSSEITIIKTIYNYAYLEILWVFITILLLFLGTISSQVKNKYHFFNPIKNVFWLIIFLTIYIPTIIIYRKYTYHLGLRGFEHNLIILGIIYLLWGLILTYLKNQKTKQKINQIFIPFMVFFTTFILIQHFTYWIGWRITPAKSYWDLLANAFIQGRLYLIDPPSLLDLTMYNGNWYVPNPPLPALLLMPIVYLFGVDKINVVDFSIFFASINSVILYFSLKKLKQKKWLELSDFNLFALLILFNFGTVQFWVSVIGRMWFLSQIVTLTFVSLAILLALYDKHPLLIGTCFGLAILARPNIFTIWIFLLFIFVQEHYYPQNIIKNWKNIFKWCVLSALPVVTSVLFLLIYNKIRFDNFLDFGYVTINGAQEIIKNVQTYGMFNIHFLPRNFSAMFLMVPHFSQNPFQIHISGYGMSIFITTPALIYLFSKYKNKLWIIGSWVSILITICLLLLYHNTGFRQFGFRYILDFITPVFFMLAVSINTKKVYRFYGLVILSIIINIYGATWYVYH